MLRKKSAGPFLLMAAVALTLCGMSVFADYQDESDAPVQPQSAASVLQDQPQAEGDSDAVPDLAGYLSNQELPTEQDATDDSAASASAQDATAQPASDPVGVLSFSNLSRRMRQGNASLLSLEETIAAIEAIDYEKMSEKILKDINSIAEVQWQLHSMGETFAARSMQQSYDALRDAYDDLKDGKLQSDNAAIVRQLKNTQDQVVMAGESLYIALIELEQTDRALTRSLAALDRTVAELELRYSLGQISALTLQQAKAGRSAMVSGQQTLQMNITICKLQLEQLAGAQPTGKLQLQAIPSVARASVDGMNLEADLEAAKQASYSLFAAGRTLDDAKETFDDARKANAYDETRYQYQSAAHTWQAAQYTHRATVEGFENGFRTLYLQVKDYHQALLAAQTTLACERDTYAAAQLKHTQGTISANSLLDAADKVSQAQDQVDSAQLNLAAAYHSYRWAVDHGILN